MTIFKPYIETFIYYYVPDMWVNISIYVIKIIYQITPNLLIHCRKEFLTGYTKPQKKYSHTYQNEMNKLDTVGYHAYVVLHKSVRGQRSVHSLTTKLQ